MSSCATKGNSVATKGNSVATKRNSVLTGKKLRPLSNKTTTHLLVALADIAMNPFPETQGIEEEVKHNKVDGNGEEGNKESEEVEEIGAPRDQDRDKGVARFDTPSGVSRTLNWRTANCSLMTMYRVMG
ncbi:hypothetical protein BC835DRAFT_1311384 [Cytidiella melzeri]|nr:hypothetical protein BC835DRAFT_1311384 [Cytidiella melzeri]